MRRKKIKRKGRMQRPTPLIQHPGGTGKTEAKAGRSLGSRPTWSIQIITDQPGVHSKNMSYKKSFRSRDSSVEQY